MVPNSIIAPSDETGETYVKPDLSQMNPFKPRRFPTPGSHPVAGGAHARRFAYKLSKICAFSTISLLQELIPIEHIDMKNT